MIINARNEYIEMLIFNFCFFNLSILLSKDRIKFIANWILNYNEAEIPYYNFVDFNYK